MDANYRSRLKLFVVRVSVPNTDWLHLYTQMYTIVIGITIFITPFPIISPPIESNILSTPPPPPPPPPSPANFLESRSSPYPSNSRLLLSLPVIISTTPFTTSLFSTNSIVSASYIGKWSFLISPIMSFAIM